MINDISSIPLKLPQAGNDTTTATVDEAKLRQTAQDFEATFIAQMLTFSGLDKALMAGGGDDMSAFTSFYIQSFAEDMAENGGFGLAETFYNQMLDMSQASINLDEGDISVDFGKL